MLTKVEAKEALKFWPVIPAGLACALAVLLRGQPPQVRWRLSCLSAFGAGIGALAMYDLKTQEVAGRSLSGRTSSSSTLGSFSSSSGTEPSTESSSSSSIPKPPTTSYLYDPANVLDAKPDLSRLVGELRYLEPMPKKDRTTRKQRGWDAEASRIENFLKKHLGFKNPGGKWFVQGVRAFETKTTIADLDNDYAFTFADGTNTFRFTAGEVKAWQGSYQVFVDDEVMQESGDDIARYLQGGAKGGEEAWKMKFVIRCAETPILTEFDGKVLAREPGETAAPIHLLSVCGMDFAGRIHDVEDIKLYVKNWDEVYLTSKTGELAVVGRRDFVPLSRKVRAQLDEELFLHDLKKITLLRLRAADALGVRVFTDVAIGLGVFAGDRIGCGERVRELSAQALREVLEENTFENIELYCAALPVFHERDNLEYFQEAFDEGYEGRVPVLFLDQDMHRIARAAAARGFATCEVNPADSHGVFGEYWQNRGPGTEEKLAMSTLGLLTQHHALNPHVTDRSRYHSITC